MNRNTFNPSSTFNYLGEQNIYEELARLKNATLQMPTYRTVFNDIADE
jgi:hypothetical protein